MDKKFTRKILSRQTDSSPVDDGPDISQLSAELAKEYSFVVFLTGQEPEGKDFWAYLAVPYHQYDAYCLAAAEGHFDLEEYGKVLAYGHGKEPPQEVQDEMLVYAN